MLEPVFRAGETYMVARDISREEALAFWCGGTHSAFVAEAGGAVLGTYYLCPNKSGPGDHVCNCGYVTDPQAAGQGVARAMLDHSLATARASGFHAMQFNAVVETNTRAIDIWTRAGFVEVGRVPESFRLPDGRLVGSLVMWKRL